MIIDFLTIKDFLIIVHLIGVALGAGGAFMSDVMFTASVRDGRVSTNELSFLKLAGRVIIVGLVVLALSGAGLFLLDPAKYLASTKFLAKMTIVAVIILNGFFFHLSHIPRIARCCSQGMKLTSEFAHHGLVLLISGAVSLTSWIAALVLGSLATVPLSYVQIIGWYLFAVALASGAAFVLRKHIFPA